MSRIVVVGAGPAGSLTAILLGRAGHAVLLVDRRADPADPGTDGRTIALSISPRGIGALDAAGLGGLLREASIELRGRAFHLEGEPIRLQEPPAGTPRNRAIERGRLAGLLLREAAATPGVEIRLGHAAAGVGYGEVVLRDRSGTIVAEPADLTVGADGTTSVVRDAIVRWAPIDFAKRISPWGYAELSIAPEVVAGWPPAIHIWPRHAWFAVAFPALDGRYLGTLVMRHATRDADPEAARRSVAAGLADAWAGLAEGERPLDRPLVPIVVVRCGRVEDGQRLVAIGDAAHATAPFMGQGVNVALEDATVLARLLAEEPIPRALARYAEERHAEGIACCDLSDRAASLLLEPPAAVADPATMALAALNGGGARYADVARAHLPGWAPVAFGEHAPG